MYLISPYTPISHKPTHTRHTNIHTHLCLSTCLTSLFCSSSSHHPFYLPPPPLALCHSVGLSSLPPSLPSLWICHSARALRQTYAACSVRFWGVWEGQDCLMFINHLSVVGNGHTHTHTHTGKTVSAPASLPIHTQGSAPRSSAPAPTEIWFTFFRTRNSSHVCFIHS